LCFGYFYIEHSALSIEHCALSLLIEPTTAGLYCAAGDFHIDPWQPVGRAVITHAHGDHLRAGSAAYLCSREAQPIVRARIDGDVRIEALDYGQEIDMNGVHVSLHPAGHILGSAQVRVEQRGEVWVASGDYKRAPDPTCTPFDPVRCHTFISEATFGLPVFRWDPPAAIVMEICAWWEEMRSTARPAVLFCYSLGKAQRVLAELARHNSRPVFVHGALIELIETYRASGVPLVPTQRATDSARGRSFAGELIVAPLSARGSTWMRRFGDHSSGFASGWMRIRGARRRRAYDRGFALSDHADWDALIRTIEDTGAERVFVTHGYTHQLARYLAERGLDAHPWRTQYEGEPERDEITTSKTQGPSSNDRGEDRNLQ
jgi:putative mRNA 3-end processing factor